MGQRLNVEIVRGDKSLANAYYHWSAYTESAIAVVEEILGTYLDIGPRNAAEMGDMLLAIRLLEATGAGVNASERMLIEGIDRYKGLTINDAVDRNRGLLSITRSGKEDTRRWEEGRVTVDLEDETICFDVMWVEYRDAYEEDQNEYGGLTPFECLPTTDIDFYSIPFDEFYMLGEFVNANPDGVRTFDDDEEIVVRWIA